MKKVIMLVVLIFWLLSNAYAQTIQSGNECFENSCSITPTDTWKLCSNCNTQRKPILRISSQTNYSFTFLGRTGDKTFEIKADIWNNSYQQISDDIMKFFFEKDSIIPLAEGYKMQMLDLKGNSLTYKLIRP